MTPQLTALKTRYLASIRAFDAVHREHVESGAKASAALSEVQAEFIAAYEAFFQAVDDSRKTCDMVTGQNVHLFAGHIGKPVRVCAWCVDRAWQVETVKRGFTLTHGICEDCQLQFVKNL